MKTPQPADVRRAIPAAAAGLVDEVVEHADRLGAAVYLVGGPVRDLLLERPIVDVDLVVDGTDAMVLAAPIAGPETEVVHHERFGTVAVTRGEGSIDLATVRRERYSHDGALPIVEPGSLEEDLARRDFSVNALALALSREAVARHGSLVDRVDGVADLEQRKLRVLHPRSFHDDPTRALRAARLAPRLGFNLSRGSRPWLRNALRDGAFGRVSGDRLRREFVKLFDDCHRGLDPSRALRLLSEWHVLAALEPGLGLDRAAVAPLRRLGRAMESPPWQRSRWRPWVVGLSLWLAPTSPSQRRHALQRFSVRGATSDHIASFAAARERWLRSLERARGRGAIDAVLRQLDEEELHGLHATAPTPSLRRQIARYAREDRGRRAPINGEDLKAIGMDGPAVGKALARIRAAFLDGGLHNREEALALARELAHRRGSPRRKSGGKRRKSR